MTTQRTASFRLMSGSLKLCRWLGLWHEDNLDSPCWQSVFIIFCLLVWYILPGFLYIARSEKTTNELLKPILEVFAMSVIVFRLLVHMINRRNLQKCFVDLQAAIATFENSPYEDVRRNLRHLLKSADYIVKIYVSIVFFQASMYGIVPAALTTYQYCTSDEMIKLPSAVMDANYVVFDHTTSYWIWILVTIVSVIVEYLMLGSVSAQDCLFWNLLHHVSCLFKIVRMEIARLDQYVDPNQFREQLASIISIHEVCFKCARCLENVLNPLLALWYCTCIVQTCYLLFAISMIEDVVVIASMMFVLQYTVFLIFSFSMLGTELMEEVHKLISEDLDLLADGKPMEMRSIGNLCTKANHAYSSSSFLSNISRFTLQSARVADAVYNTRWYMRNAAESRLLLFMKMRANRPVGITAAKFFFLKRSTFADAMKTAFSYFTIMQQFYGKQ